MEPIMLSDFIRNVPSMIGLFIGADMNAKKKRFLYGQPQLKTGHYALGDTIEEAMDIFITSNKVHCAFPSIIIEYDNYEKKDSVNPERLRG